MKVMLLNVYIEDFIRLDITNLVLIHNIEHSPYN